MRNQGFSFRRTSLYLAALMAVAACGSSLDPLAPDTEGDGGGGNVGSDGTAYSVAGQVNVVDSTVLDSDTNDPTQQGRASNNTLATSQPVSSNPVTIAGYLNAVQEGPRGPNYDAGDRIDSYSIRLEKDQIVELDFVASTSVIDVDMLIYDDQQELVGKSNSSDSSRECVRIQEAGTYSVVAGLYEGSRGGTLYQVRISAPGSGTQCSNTTNVQSLIIPGEVIVKPASPDRIVSKSESRKRYQAKAIKGSMQPGQMTLVAVPSDLTALSGTTAIKGKSVTRSEFITGTRKSEKTRAIERTLIAAKMMNESSQFSFASVNEMRQPLQASPQLTGAYPPDDRLYYAQKWHYDAIELPAAMQTISDLSPKPTRRPIVAVVDTGSLTQHPDLQNMLVQGIDAISDPSRSLDGDGVDRDVTDVTVSGAGTTGFHGTHVAGTVAAESFNGKYGAGVAPMAQIMTVRVLGKGGGSTMDIIQGMLWAAGLPNQTGIASPAESADIFNLSLGGQGPCTTAEESALSDIRAAGKIIVAASGNESKANQLTPVGSPANCPSIISVGAIDARNGRSYYSNGGPKLDIVAPGGDTSSRSTNTGLSDGVGSIVGVFTDNGIGHEFKLNQGTSMASPHAAGIFALMKYIAPNINQADIETLIGNGSLTTDFGPAGKDDQFGHGLLSARMAVLEAQRLAGGGGTTPIGQIQASPASVEMGGSRAQAEILLRASGTTEDRVTNVTTDSDIVTVAGVNVDQATGLGTYSITVDRSRIANGQSLFAKVLVGLSSGSRLEIPVSANRSSGLGGTVGPIYILVLDIEKSTSDKIEIAEQSSVSAPTNGRYDYQVPNVPGASKIAVFAGTDLDNDGLICGLGEACGAYPVLGSQTQVLEPGGQNVTGVDFAVEAQSGLDGAAALSEVGPTDTTIKKAGIPRLR